MFYNTEPIDYGLALYRAKLQQAERVRFRQSTGTGWNLSQAREFARRAVAWLASRYEREAELCAQGLTPACDMLTV